MLRTLEKHAAAKQQAEAEKAERQTLAKTRSAPASAYSGTGNIVDCLLVADPPHRVSQSRRARGARDWHSLSQPVPRRSYRQPRPIPDDAGQHHCRCDRRICCASEADAITISPDRLLELQAGESFTPSDDTFGFFEFPIDPERAAPILRAALSTTDTRARIYDLSGNLVVDSRQLHARGILRFNLPDPMHEDETGWMEMWSRFISWLRQAELPLYKELGSTDGRGYPEVALALDGSAASIVRVNDKGRLIVSVAVPIQRSRVIAGALLLSTRDGEIDEIVTAERLGILRVFLIAAVVTSTLSILLAGTIAGPVRKLSEAAERVRRGVKSREQIPDFSDRKDEIGQLSQSLRDMTKTLYQRMDAIEAFAADVAHELKNPLTSLRSAVETLSPCQET